MSAPVLQVRIPSTVSLGELDPLYLFACEVEWRKRRRTLACEELLWALASLDATTRLVAGTLLDACHEF